eukprot:scaffold174850_cov31-Prasinocladus_malaysianus.AAC.2
MTLQTHSDDAHIVMHQARWRLILGTSPVSLVKAPTPARCSSCSQITPISFSHVASHSSQCRKRVRQEKCNTQASNTVLPMFLSKSKFVFHCHV